MSCNDWNRTKRKLKENISHLSGLQSQTLRRKVKVVTLNISLLVDLETPVATVCGLIAQVTANDRCSHEEVRQSPAFFFCEQPDFMLHMFRVFEQQDTANRVSRHAEKLEECSLSPAAPHLTANCGCSFLH